jgi:DNA-binding PadR family transcriptional regulator
MREFKHTVIKALLPHIILIETNNQPIHGYQLIISIRKKHGIYLGPSSIYPLLNELEKQGLIQSQWIFTNEKPRKVYTITGKGKIQLRQTTTTTLTLINQMIGEKHEV